MISFDLAPNLELPLLKNTPGSFYFNQRRTSALFGFNLEAPNFQYNFLIDEFDVKNLTKGFNDILKLIIMTTMTF